MKLSHKTTIFGGALIGVSISLFGAATPAEKPASAASLASLFPDQVLAKGKGVEILQSQVEEAFLAFKANQTAQGLKVPEDSRSKVEADILDKLIATRLILIRATAEDKIKGKEIYEKVLSEQMKQAPSEESFNRQVRALGLTPEQFRARIMEEATVQAVIDREIKSKKTISDAEAKEFYEKNPKFFLEPESVRVSHILFSTQDALSGRELSDDQKLEKKRLAEKILAQAKTGADFGGLVKQHSEDQTSKLRGGEYVIARSPRPAVPEFEAAAFSLASNQISDIVTTRFGYHIIKGGEKIPAKTTEFAKVETRIKETLLQDAVQKDLPAYLDLLKKEADVEKIPAGSKK